ncbi:MAG: hypothetical protein U0610_20920 [bacterium]
MAADTQEPPLRVSVPIRYSPDGRSWGEGIVTSIAGVTLVVQTTAPPDLRARLYFALGLGPEGTFHGEGRVTTPPDPGSDAPAASAFGLRFDGTPNELAAVVSRLVRGYPGPVEIDADLRLRWPVTADAALPTTPADAEGLGLWTAGHQVCATRAEDGPAARTGNVNEPLHAYVTVLRQLATELRASGADRVVLTYRGRPLAPGTGVPAHVLDAGLEALARVSPLETGTTAAAPTDSGPRDDGTWSLDLEDLDAPTAPVEMPSPAEVEEGPTEAEVLWDHPILELAAAQMRVMDALATADWRYERLTPELKEALDRDRTLLDGINLRIATSAEETGIDESAATAISEANDAIGTLVARAGWHSTAIESAEASASFYETFQIEKERLARQAVITARTAAREAEEKAAARKEREEQPRKAEPKTKTKAVESRETKTRSRGRDASEAQKPRVGLIAVILLACVMAIARIVTVFQGDRNDAPKAKTVDMAQVRADIAQRVPAVPVVDLRIEEKTLKVVVDPGWLNRGANDRHGDLELLSPALMSHGFWRYHVITPDGQQRASFIDGKIDVQGFVAPKSAEDGGR